MASNDQTDAAVMLTRAVTAANQAIRTAPDNRVAAHRAVTAAKPHIEQAYALRIIGRKVGAHAIASTVLSTASLATIVGALAAAARGRKPTPRLARSALAVMAVSIGYQHVVGRKVRARFKAVV
jgi:hypothetical protein